MSIFAQEARYIGSLGMEVQNLYPDRNHSKHVWMRPFGRLSSEREKKNPLSALPSDPKAISNYRSTFSQAHQALSMNNRRLLIRNSVVLLTPICCSYRGSNATG